MPSFDICQTLFVSNFVNFTLHKTLVVDNGLVIIESVPLSILSAVEERSLYSLKISKLVKSTVASVVCSW